MPPRGHHSGPATHRSALRPKIKDRDQTTTRQPVSPGNPAPPDPRDGDLAAVTARQQRQTMDLPPLAAPHG